MPRTKRVKWREIKSPLFPLEQVEKIGLEYWNDAIEEAARAVESYPLYAVAPSMRSAFRWGQATLAKAIRLKKVDKLESKDSPKKV